MENNIECEHSDCHIKACDEKAVHVCYDCKRNKKSKEPKYDYYVDFRTMSNYIKKQNKDIKAFSDTARSYYFPLDNMQLAKLLHITPYDIKQVYADNDINVKLLWD